MNKLLKKFLIYIPKFLNNEEINILNAEIHKYFLGKESYYLNDKHLKYWEKRANFWELNTPPVRPSTGDLSIYSDFLGRTSKKGNILILGSTPELRDLVVEETDAKIYVADFSYSMLTGMLKFTKKVDPKKEVWVKEKWLELPFPSKFFDVILGDVVLHQVTPELELVFLEKMKCFLKDDGVFITRAFFLNKSFLESNLRDIAKTILSGPLTYQQKYSLLKLQTVWLFSDLVNRKFNRRLSAEKFGELIKEFPDKILKKVHNVLLTDKDSYRSWSPPREEDLINMVSKPFCIKDKNVANDYQYAEYFPILILAPKQPINSVDKSC